MTDFPRLTRFRVRNFRVLRDVELSDLTRMMALLGPNGSGKSTFLDALMLVADSVLHGINFAIEKRTDTPETLLSERNNPNIDFQLECEISPGEIIKYLLRITCGKSGFYVGFEDFQSGADDNRLYYDPFAGVMNFGHNMIATQVRIGGLNHPMLGWASNFSPDSHVVGIVKFFEQWAISDFHSNLARLIPAGGVREHLSATGDNLINVLLYLHREYPNVFAAIEQGVRRSVPGVEAILPELLPSGHVILKLKDRAASDAVLAHHASDGTMALIYYLVLFLHPNPRPLIFIEEPETHLHPKLLSYLSEECAIASGRSQIIVATHSPFFVNEMLPEQVWAFGRDRSGSVCVQRASDMPMIKSLMEHGGKIGDLWMENFLSIGNP